MNLGYGTNTFYNTSPGNPLGGVQFLLVTEPNSSHQMFLYVQDATDPGVPSAIASAIPAVYTNANYVPTNPPADNSSGGNTLDNPDWNNPSANDLMYCVNSYYWGREQFANLSTNFLNTAPSWDPMQLTVNDFILPRLRHWNEGSESIILNNLSMEREPSPDNGITLGEMTWYDYPNKLDFNIAGTADTPILKIKVLPDGSEWYQLNQLDQWNNVTNMIATYSINGNVYTRTNSYVYASNGQDLLQAIRPDGVTNAAYGYDTNHRVLFMTNALGEVTSYTYNVNEQLTVITPMIMKENW